MKKFSILFLTLTLAFNFLFAQSNLNIVKLDAKAFAEKIKAFPNAPLVDIRTAGEFTEGHIEKAINYDWYGANFEKQISLLDKSKPVFIYCHSGGRSAAAVTKMKSLGFINIYELAGGITNWIGAGMHVNKK